jgi:hypothetical protein
MSVLPCLYNSNSLNLLVAKIRVFGFYDGIKFDAIVKSQFSDGFVKSSQARRAKPEE